MYRAKLTATIRAQWRRDQSGKLSLASVVDCSKSPGIHTSQVHVLSHANNIICPPFVSVSTCMGYVIYVCKEDLDGIGEVPGIMASLAVSEEACWFHLADHHCTEAFVSRTNMSEISKPTLTWDLIGTGLGGRRHTTFHSKEAAPPHFCNMICAVESSPLCGNYVCVLMRIVIREGFEEQLAPLLHIMRSMTTHRYLLYGCSGISAAKLSVLSIC